MTEITFPTVGGEASGYLAEPESGTGYGVIVLQEWWGLDEHIRSVCDRLAADGVLALAPDLYRGETTTQPDEAEQKMMALRWTRSRRTCAAPPSTSPHTTASEGQQRRRRRLLPGRRARGVGGGNDPKSRRAVTYYYVMPHGKPDFAKIRARARPLRHGRRIHPVEDAQALEGELGDAGVEDEFEYYDGAGHAFFNDTNRLGTYDSAAAEKSWERTIGFLRERLDG